MRFVEITSIEPAGKNHVYDLSMAEGEDPSFIANGVVVHNSAYSTFLETCNADREDLTERVFDYKIFPLVAVTNNLYKDPSRRARSNNVVDFLFNRNNRANLKMPTLHWRKSLEAKGEENLAELLQLASDHNIPIPMKMWMAAAHIEPEDLLRDLEEDKTLREKVQKFTGQDMSYEASQQAAEEARDDPEFDSEERGRGSVDRTEASRIKGSLSSQSLRNLIQNPRVPLLAREFKHGDDQFELTKTGKLKHVPSAIAARRRREMDNRIIKIARMEKQDPNYAEALRRRNQEKLGRTTID